MTLSKAVKAMNEARRNGNALEAEKALRTALKKRGITKCGAYRAMMDIWNVQIEKALEGNTESAKLIIERLDGKPKQQVDQNVNVNVQFEQALIEGRQRVAERKAISRKSFDSFGHDYAQIAEYEHVEQSNNESDV